MVDSASRWPACFPLRTLSAKPVCEAIIQLRQFTGCADMVPSDCGTNFTSQLTCEFMNRLGCSPRFATPGHHIRSSVWATTCWAASFAWPLCHLLFRNPWFHRQSRTLCTYFCWLQAQTTQSVPSAWAVKASGKPTTGGNVAASLLLKVLWPVRLFVLKGKNGCDGIRLAADYRYVNRFTERYAFPVQDISSLVQHIGRATYITKCDAKSGYYQTPVHPVHRWLTAFVCDEGLLEFTRTPFGMKSSGATFIRAIQEILKPIKDFTDAYVDDMAVFSGQWSLHIRDLEKVPQGGSIFWHYTELEEL